MSLSLPIASRMTFPNEKAVQEVVKKQPFEYVASWDAAVVKPGN